MNFVFWFLIIIALFFIWFGARKLFVKIGKSASSKYEEVSDIVSGKYDVETIIDDSHIPDEVLEDFQKYYKTF